MCEVLILHLTYASCIFLTLSRTMAAEPQDQLAPCSSIILTQLLLTSMGPWNLLPKVVTKHASPVATFASGSL